MTQHLQQDHGEVMQEILSRKTCSICLNTRPLLSDWAKSSIAYKNKLIRFFYSKNISYFSFDADCRRQNIISNF